MGVVKLADYRPQLEVVEHRVADNQHAKQQIALESQRTQEDIKVAVADDDCASRPVPAAAADRLRKYADNIRAGSNDAVTSEPAR